MKQLSEKMPESLDWKGQIKAPTKIFFNEETSLTYASADTLIDGLMCEIRRMNKIERTQDYLDFTNNMTTLAFESRMDILGFYLGMREDGGNMTSVFGSYHGGDKRLAYTHFGKLNKLSIHPSLFWDRDAKWFKEGGDKIFIDGLLKMCEDLTITRVSPDILVPVFYIYMLAEYISTGEIHENISKNIRWVESVQGETIMVAINRYEDYVELSGFADDGDLNAVAELELFEKEEPWLAEQYAIRMGESKEERNGASTSKSTSYEEKEDDDFEIGSDFYLWTLNNYQGEAIMVLTKIENILKEKNIVHTVMSNDKIRILDIFNVYDYDGQLILETEIDEQVIEMDNFLYFLGYVVATQEQLNEK